MLGTEFPHYFCLFEIGQTSPDSLESSDQNGELVNGTAEEHAESEGDRRPSLNASTPDDDLSLRERTSTVPIPPARTIAQVYMNQSAEAQSQPDLLGIPYTTHENVLLRKRNINNSLGPQLSADSRLSMPPFVFSSTSLRSFENSPSTSSSYANDMSLRAGGNESENTGENSEADDTSLNEHSNRNLNGELEALSNSVQTNTLGAPDGPSETIFEMISEQTYSDAESTQPSSSVSNSEPVSSSLSTEHNQSTLANSDTMINEVNSEDSSEIRDVNADDVSLNHSGENNSYTGEIGTNAASDVSETVIQEDEPVANERNIDNINDVNEVQVEHEETEDSTSASDVVSPLESSLLVDTSFLDQQDSAVSVEMAPSSEDTSTLPLQTLSQDDVLTVDLPPVEPSTSLGERDVTLGEELSTSGNGLEDGTNILQESNNMETNSANRPNTLNLNNFSTLSVTATHDSASASTSDMEHSSEQRTRGIADENNHNQNSVGHTSFSMFGTDVIGASFMNLESEPDIMNVLSLSNTSTSDAVMPTQSADIEGTSPRRAMAIGNLRTLFQIPDRDNTTQTFDNSLGRISQDETTPSEEVSSDTDVLENSVTTQRVTGPVGISDNSDAIEPDTGTSDLSGSSSNAYGTADVSDISSSSSTSVVENSTSSELVLSAGNELTNTEMQGMPSGQYEVEQAVQFSESTENEISQSTRTETSPSGATVNASLISQSSTSDEPRSPRTSLSSPVPSITQVRYLRSKNLSIRLPSRTSSPLPVVHVVPPNVPVSRRNSENDLLLSPIEVDPILPATRLESSARESSSVVTRSLARDVFDAPDGSREVINAGASTSRYDTSVSEPTAAASTSSTSDVSNSAPQRRSSSGSSQSGNAKNRKKIKSRSRSNRQSSTTEPTEGAESSGQVQARRRIVEERPNRNLVDNFSEQSNDESSSSHHRASIYNQISDFARDEDVLDESLPQRKYIFVL